MQLCEGEVVFHSALSGMGDGFVLWIDANGSPAWESWEYLELIRSIS